MSRIQKLFRRIFSFIKHLLYLILLRIQILTRKSPLIFQFLQFLFLLGMQIAILHNLSKRILILLILLPFFSIRLILHFNLRRLKLIRSFSIGRSIRLCRSHTLIIKGIIKRGELHIHFIF